MPFWYMVKQDNYDKALNDDSLLSIDNDFDPEKNIEVVHFELLSRLVEYKDIVIRYIQRNRNVL